MNDYLQIQKQRHNLPFLSPESTLVDRLRWRSIRQPQQKAYTFLVDGEIEEQTITYGQLDQQVRSIAAQLQKEVAVGERVLLLYPSGIEYIVAFLACLYAGVIAVPAYPPSSRRSMDRIQAITTNAGIITTLTTDQMLPKIQRWSEHIPELQKVHWLVPQEDAATYADQWQPYAPEASDLAFLQYTSGTTGTPKGVMVSHNNLMHNLTMIQNHLQLHNGSINVSWLPMFHDMGLIAGVLQPLYTGFPGVLLAPAAFIQRPLRWLQAISTYQGTITYAPNFAYELCVERISPEERAQLNLSSWRVAANGAEPVHAETLKRFVETFAPCNLTPTIFAPCYGMAEATLMISGGPVSRKTPTVQLDRSQLEKNRVVPSSNTTFMTQTIVGCGDPAPEQKVVIVHPDTARTCQPDEIGEIWIAGPCVAGGYWQLPEETEKTFHAYVSDTSEGPFLRTGDLGFQQNNELFITGRLKDMIIIRGRNYYPQDIEQIAGESHPLLRQGYGAAFAIEEQNEERLVVVHEVQRHASNPEEIISAIRQAIAEQYEIQVYAVALIRYGSILKTSSGKIQRRRCQDAFLHDDFPIIARFIQEQVSSDAPEESEEQRQRFLRQLETASNEEKKELLITLISKHIDAALGIKASPQQNLLALGLDSLTGTQLMNRLQQYLDHQLPSALAFIMEDPTIEKLAEYLIEELAKEVSANAINEAALNEWLGDFTTEAAGRQEERF